MIAAKDLFQLLHRISLYDDSLAYKELFLTYHSRLLHFSTMITQSKEASEEVVSDVFMKVWTSRAGLINIENFNVWVYIITKHLSINSYKKLKRERQFSLDEMVVEFNTRDHDPHQMLITKQMHDRIFLAIAELPPRCQLIFKLVREDGLKHREIAELLNLSVKTVENQMTIALRKIGQAVEFKMQKTSSS